VLAVSGCIHACVLMRTSSHLFPKKFERIVLRLRENKTVGVAGGRHNASVDVLRLRADCGLEQAPSIHCPGDDLKWQDFTKP
jgi:hypothetical protein